MTFLSRLLRRSTVHEPLIGCWHLERSEDPEADRDVEIEFLANGHMQYSIPAGDRWQIMKLTWQVEKEFLLTNQLSHPRVERTQFHLESPGTLILHAGPHRSWYKKGSKRAPAA